MQFTRLSLSGFKSFVDPTDLIIAPGLTGVVGPNGCGKSNLVEGLRWVMGETSAKSMRGTEMDDMIFGGTASRPARNLAEVILHIDNIDRSAPAAFNDSAEIEVIRRIDRGDGSTYRINGREVRAQDVRLMFADQATGAHSTALVGQGQIGAIINARPVARRSLLEEAAGITGLHSRRHDAELRLRAAEGNLARLDDVIATLEAQLRGLKRQARQASRYRNLSGHIRRAEATLLHLEWIASREAVAAAQRELDLATRAAAACAATAASAATARTEAVANLPRLREREAEAAARLHRLAVARDRLEAEEARIKATERDIEARLQQIAGDITRENALATQTEAEIERLRQEAETLAAAAQTDEDAVAAAETARAEAQAEVSEQEISLRDAIARLAAIAARREGIERQSREWHGRLERLTQQAAEFAEERAGLLEEAATGSAAEGDADLVTAREVCANADRQARSAQAGLAAAVQAEDEARGTLQEIETASAAAEAEIRALAGLLSDQDDEQWPPLIDQLVVAPGYEVALAGALRDELVAATDASAPVHWRQLVPGAAGPALPAGVESLDRHVQAPPFLARRLTQVGIVARSAGARLQDQLVQGQRLVSREGDLWRWDGYVADASAADAAARRLDQRSRLVALRDALAPQHRQREDARSASETAYRARATARAADADAREAQRQAEASLNAALAARSHVIEAQIARTTRLDALDNTERRLAADIEDARGEIAAAETARGDLTTDQEAARIADLRQSVLALRRTLAARQEAYGERKREAAVRAARGGSVAAEATASQSRLHAVRDHLGALEGRRDQATLELSEIRDRPARIEVEREALFEHISQAEEARREAADKLAESETELAACDRADKSAQQALAGAREEQLRRESTIAQGQQHEEAVVARIRDKLECDPEATFEVAELKEGADLPEPEMVSPRLDRLKRERENMGPVNLRAEAEAAEVEEQFESLQLECTDLEAAIARLRQGIGTLNREGRQRLLAAFEEVNGHFGELFVRLFGGGRAHLALTESDDPLEAGLEIMASPPGKHLQVMSLLSGGEQALTAIALLFAVFLTNPAPICVLDEVDAPLDDANVDRFCRLLDEIAAGTQTRFIIVTHHPLTMSRMDRLFGVTMSERGISQMVSVDLSRAVDLRAAE